MRRIRHWMKISIQQIEFPLPDGFECKSIEVADAFTLGHLMDSSFRDTIDYEGESIEQSIQEMKDTINGKYGEFISRASFLVNCGNDPISAILITTWKEHPLVAYSMTDKNFLGRGFGKYLLGKAVSSLVGSKWKEVFLVVTEGNVAAEKLYERVGFKRAGQALQGSLPPVESVWVPEK